MRYFKDQSFHGLTDIDTSRVIENLEFHRCNFTSSSLSMGANPKLRSIVRRVRLIDCRVRASFIGGAILEDVEVSDLETGTEFFLGVRAVFRHVVFSGKMGRFHMNPRLGLLLESKKVQEEFDAANARFYRGVDWALDIRKAEFYECSLTSVPYQLVRRDRDTQVVVLRERALEGSWRDLDLTGTFWGFHLEKLLKSGTDGIVLVAPKAHPNYEKYLAGLKILREAHVAEPD